MNLFLFQVGDVGMARDLEEDSCYMSKGGLIPVRWTAPEVRILKTKLAAVNLMTYTLINLINI